MVRVPFSKSDYARGLTKAEALWLRNRYFEENPQLSDDGAALLTRPGKVRWVKVGEGPVRGLYSQAGAFDGTLFVVSHEDLYRVDPDLTVTLLFEGLFAPYTGYVSMAITGSIGAIGEYMFLADGRNLLVYDGTSVAGVTMPDDVGAISVGYINGFVIVIPAQGEGINGRFYWIEPGAKTVDSLNFATAERSPDAIHGVVIFGDQFWVPGEQTTEVYLITGDIDAPVQRVQGILFDRGAWEGTAVKVKDSMVITDRDGGVFVTKGGKPQRISTPAIEEQIREAIQFQEAF